MATWDDVRAVALALPETFEREGRGGLPDWRVKDGARDKGFVWERPLRKSDLAALGSTAPSGPILGARVPDVGAKDALIADDPGVYFTTPHFDGYPAILVQLDHIDVTELAELVVEAWLVQAPKKLAAEYLTSRDADGAEG
jgi:hypothetical protein